MKTLLLLILLILSLHVSAQTIRGKIVGISDGDTITILDSLHHKIKIRLYGIDCPEKGQDFGTAAKKFTSAKCFSKVVYVQTKGKDKYSRTLGIVVLPDRTELNLALLQSGYAWHYKAFDKSKKYADAEVNARQHKSGLWAGKNPTAPWDYRKAKKNKREAVAVM